MIQLYTIGFSGKSAEQFFSLLNKAGIKQITDTRLNNVSQLSGFAKAADLKFFANKIGKIDYEYNPDFAPTKELLSKYRTNKMSWQQYEIEYLNLLDMRKIARKTDIEKMHQHCLLCSEHTPEKCHRRLLAEYLKEAKRDIEIIHLV